MFGLIAFLFLTQPGSPATVTAIPTLVWHEHASCMTALEQLRKDTNYHVYGSCIWIEKEDHHG